MKYPIKEGSFILLLKNSAGTDLRKYQVVLNAVYKPLRYELQMRIPANNSLTQPLPMINLTNENNIYRVLLLNSSQDPNKSVFFIDCEREVSVQPNNQEIANLSFKPRANQTYNAILKMENVTTEQTIEY